MKKILLIILTSSFFLALGAPGIAGNSSKAGELSFLMGDVSIMDKNGEWSPAKFGQSVFQGNSVRTGADSSCEITLADSSIIRMDSNTEQLLEQADFTKKKKVSLFTRAGRLWLNARKIIGENDEFSVRSDKAVCAIRGTVFRVDARDEDTQIAVYKGKVATWSALPPPPAKLGPPHPVEGPKPVTMERWVQIVAEMQQITIDRQGRYKMADLDLAREKDDPWVKWNRERDLQVKR